VDREKDPSNNRRVSEESDGVHVTMANKYLNNDKKIIAFRATVLFGGFQIKISKRVDEKTTLVPATACAQ
jgi:hypothetical protein